MSKLETEKGVQLVSSTFYKCNESEIGALRQFSAEKGLKNFTCSESTVRKLIQRFEATDSVHDLPRCGRPKIEESAVENVRDAVQD